MSSLTDLLTVVLNALFIFATVSYVSSAITDGLAGLLRRREALLAWGVARLLGDKRFDGLALEVYNHPQVNPLCSGAARNKAELGFLPTWIDPTAFATALLEVLHVIPSAPTAIEKISALTVDATVPEATRIENAIANATRRIEAEGELESKARTLIRLVTNLIRCCEGRPDLLIQSIAQWFETTMRSVTEHYRKEIKLWTFVIGFVIAALLDLQPIPVGGLLALTRATAPEPAGAQVAQAVPMLANLLEWGLVASSTLFGAQFWYAMIKQMMALRGGQPPPTPASGTTPPAGGEPPPEPPAGPATGRTPARRKSRTPNAGVTPEPRAAP
jgi:hypothetical protein